MLPLKGCGLAILTNHVKALSVSKKNIIPFQVSGQAVHFFWFHALFGCVEVIIYEIMAVYNSTQVLLNVYEVCAILYDMVSSDFHLDTLSGASVFLMITFRVVDWVPIQIVCELNLELGSRLLWGFWSVCWQIPSCFCRRPKNIAEPLIWLQYHCRQMELLDTWLGSWKYLETLGKVGLDAHLDDHKNYHILQRTSWDDDVPIIGRVLWIPVVV